MRSVRDAKDKLNAQFARMGHALSSPKRLEMLELLRQCEKCVETLAANTGMSVANTSRHLQILKSAGLVETRREGIHMIYRVADEQVHLLVSTLKKVAQSRLADVDRVLADIADGPVELDEVDRSQLLQLTKAGKIVVLDVRPEDEYCAHHLPCAHSIPLSQLAARLHELPRKGRIVVYCRGPYCLLAGEAVRILRRAGYDAIRLGEGLAEWMAAGMPVTDSGLPDTAQRR